MSSSGKLTTSYSVGDPVRVSDAEGEYIGIVVDRLTNDTLSVQMIKKFADGLYRTTSDAYEVPSYAIEEHKALQSDDDAPKAFDQLGFRMLDGATFVKHTDEDTNDVPVGLQVFEVRSSASDDDSDDNSLCDFIVADEDCEPFTMAEETNAFVKDTHQAVRDFQSWQPKTPAEIKAKKFIEGQEHRAIIVDDNARFSRNMPPASKYSEPS